MGFGQALAETISKTQTIIMDVKSPIYAISSGLPLLSNCQTEKSYLAPHILGSKALRGLKHRSFQSSSR